MIARVCLGSAVLFIASGYVFAAACSPFTAANTDPNTSTDAAGSDSADSGDSLDSGADALSCDGRDCGKGACAAGRCQPFALNAQPVPEPWYIAVDDTDVYFTSLDYTPVTAGDGKIRSLPKNGGEVRPIANSGQAFDLISVKDNIIYTAVSVGLATTDGIWSVRKTGKSSPTQLLMGPSLDIARQGDQLFIAASAPASIKVLNINGSDVVESLSIPTPSAASPEGVAADNSHIFFTSHDASGGSVHRLALDGMGGPELLEKQAGAPRRIVADNDGIYWTELENGGAVRRRDKGTSGASTELLKASVGVGSILVDGAYLYAALEGDGRVVRMDKSNGGNLVVIADGLNAPTGLAQDEKTLYFTERKAGLVKAVRK